LVFVAVAFLVAGLAVPVQATPPSSDERSTAPSFDGSFSVTLNSRGATSSPDDPVVPCDPHASGYTVWAHYVSQTDGSAGVSFQGDYHDERAGFWPAILVLSGSEVVACEAGPSAGCHFFGCDVSDGSEPPGPLDWRIERGDTFDILVAHRDAPGTLRISLNESPTALTFAFSVFRSSALDTCTRTAAVDCSGASEGELACSVVHDLGRSCESPGGFGDMVCYEVHSLGHSCSWPEESYQGVCWVLGMDAGVDDCLGIDPEGTFCGLNDDTAEYCRGKPILLGL
jgi:hypothetical protein